MHVQLLVSSWCSSCQQAQHVWTDVCARHGLSLEVLDLDTLAGETAANRHQLKIMPAVLIDDHPRAIGVQTEAEAEVLLNGALGKSGG